MGGADDKKPGQPPPRVWVLAGHKAGDNAQLMALAGALGWPVEVKRLTYRPTELVTNLLLRVTLAGIAEGRESLARPWPDLVLTAGRRNEPIARWIKSRAGPGTRLVHLGRPWAPLDRFDLVVTTPQYFVPEAKNVLTIGMPLHAITPTALDDASEQWRPRLRHLPHPRIAVLVGGASQPYRFGPLEAAELGRRIEDKAARLGGSLLITTSARTPADSIAALEAQLHSPRFFHRWQAGAGENPYRAFLALADEIVVTGDSISMLAEATAMGKPVSIFDLGGMRGSGPRPLTLAHDWHSLLHLILMRIAPRRMRRDTRILLQAAVADGRATWLGESATRVPGGKAEDLPRAAAAVRRLFAKT